MCDVIADTVSHIREYDMIYDIRDTFRLLLGMFLYLSPWPLMPLHWGWDELHDLCFKCTRKDQIWRPITTQTVVAHHTA
jgi:hypothetical protein